MLKPLIKHISLSTLLTINQKIIKIIITIIIILKNMLLWRRRNLNNMWNLLILIKGKRLLGRGGIIILWVVLVRRRRCLLFVIIWSGRGHLRKVFLPVKVPLKVGRKAVEPKCPMQMWTDYLPKITLAIHPIEWPGSDQKVG